jgi:hypothetical protein
MIVNAKCKMQNAETGPQLQFRFSFCIRHSEFCISQKLKSLFTFTMTARFWTDEAPLSSVSRPSL